MRARPLVLESRGPFAPPPKSWVRILGALFAVALALAAPRAAAGDRDPVAAEALFREGRAAAARGDWPVACARFAESQRLDPSAGTALNLARCEERLGRLASAWEHYRQVVDARPDDERLDFARRRVAELEPRLPRLRIEPAVDLPAGARITRDDVPIGAASLSLAVPIDPGAHAITVEAPGRAARRVEVVAEEGVTREVLAEAGPPLVAPAAAPRPPPPAPPVIASPTRRVGFIVAGVGVVALAAGAVTGALALARRDEMRAHCDAAGFCSPQGVDAAHAGATFAKVSTVTTVVGAASVGLGVYLVVAGGPHGGATVRVGAP